MRSRELVRLIREAAQSKKARDIVELDLRDRTDMADFFVICEGDTDRQTRAIAEAIREAARAQGVVPFSTSGEREGTWILLDFLQVVVHVFLPGERDYYDLESLWAETRRRAGGRTQPKRRSA
jgi:ribosome-associated protein